MAANVDARDPLSTTDVVHNLGSRATSGTIVTAVSQAAGLVANLIGAFILARLLTPKDFGLVAMVTAVTGFLDVLKDGGLSTATIQRPHITQPQVSNLFWINIAIGVLLTLSLASLAPVLSWFYHEPRLIPVALALSLSFLITSSAIQHQALLRRQMQFRTLAKIQIAATVASVLVSLAMAKIGFTYWSLVAAILVLSIFSCLGSWYFSAWRPSWPSRGVGTSPLVGFGAHLTGSALVQAVTRTADTLLIGRFFGPTALGVYSRASSLLMNPIQQFTSPFYAVLVPTLSCVQNDAVRYRRAYLKVVQLITVIALPLAGFLLSSAKPIVLTLLGDQWNAAVPIFAAFSVVAIYAPLATASTWLFTSQGRGRDIFYSGMLTSAVALAAIVLGLPFGPLGVAVAYSVSGLLIRLPILFHFAGRAGPVKTHDLWATLLSSVPLGLASFAAGSGSNFVLNSERPFVQLAIASLAAVLAVVACIACSARHRLIVLDALQRIRFTRRDRGPVRCAAAENHASSSQA